MRIPNLPALAALALLATAPTFAFAQGMADHDHGSADSAAAAAPARDPNLPADEGAAREALDHSPRHGEYVDIKMPGGGVPIRTWVVYPERKDKAPVVLVIHEIFGLSDWIRALADQLAREGFLAVVPDLISGMGPGGGGTESMSSRDSVVAAIRALTPETARARLDATRAWALAQPSANGRLATMGFCWGGGKSFEYAAAKPAPDAAVVYYGVSPDSTTLLAVSAPVLGLYGGDDARVDATIDPARQSLAAQKKRYEPNLYDGAGHGFLRQQTGRDGANMKATAAAWPRTLKFLRETLEKPKKK